MEILKTCLFGMKYLSKKKKLWYSRKGTGFLSMNQYQPMVNLVKLAEVRGGPFLVTVSLARLGLEASPNHKYVML